MQAKTVEDDYNRLLPVYEAGESRPSRSSRPRPRLDVQREVVANLKKNIEVHSPITGVVTARNYESGDLFAAQPILHIMQIDPLKVVANISEQYFRNVKVGMPVDLKVDIFPGETFPGTVSLIYPALDPATRTFKVEVKVPNAKRTLRPGMFARTGFNMGEKEGVMVPDVAVQKQVGTAERFLYVIKGDSVAERRRVEVGRQVGDRVDILSGVAPGERVAVTALSKAFRRRQGRSQTELNAPTHMKIYESAVRKPVSTVLLFVGVMVFGLFSLMNLAVDQYPEIEIPQISVITMYPGANAAEIETNITRVLEDNLNTVSNLKKLTSKSQDNVSMITVEFEYGSDLNEGANEIRDVVSRVQSMLPDDIDYPTIFKFSTSMIPVMMIAVTAEESYPALNKLLDDKLVNVLNRVDGVGAVSVIGAPEREVQVNVDPAKARRLQPDGRATWARSSPPRTSIFRAARSTSATTPSTSRPTASSNSATSLRKVVVSNAGGRTVMLSDVAEIRDTLEKFTMDERVNGQRGVRVMFQKQSGANTVNIVHEIQKRLPEIQKTLPKDVKMELIFEGSQEITDAIGSLSETIMYAFIFVVLVVMIFLGRWRATLIICMTIPVSLICSFIYLFATGSTLNIISLSSLSIAIGMVVDDAIVVLENITTHIERGSSPKEAAIYATNEVWLSVIATTLVVVAVFLPLTMVPGMAGILFREPGLDRDDRGLRLDDGGHLAHADDVGLPPQTRRRRTRLQGRRHRLQADRPCARMARRHLRPFIELGGPPPPHHDLLDDGPFRRFAGTDHPRADRVLPAFGQQPYFGDGRAWSRISAWSIRRASPGR